MPPITALLHTANHALRLGRTLETLFPCSEILIVDHRSTDATRRIAREYGARIIDASIDQPANHHLALARHDWLLWLRPGESLSESLQASLFDWRALSSEKISAKAFSVFVREQSSDGYWLELPAPETRLIPRDWPHWKGKFPAIEPLAIALEGALLRFAIP